MTRTQEPIRSLSGWIRDDHARMLEQLGRDCPALKVSFYPEDARGWRLIGSKNGAMVIDVRGKVLGRVRSEFLEAYATCLLKGLITV